jgi:GT2 family glycosyltransferase
VLNGHSVVLARRASPSPVGIVRHWEGSAGGGLSWAPAASQGVSVVLCTYRRPRSVARFLESLRRQTRPADELLVIDASGDDDTERVVTGWDGARQVRYWRVVPPLRGLTRQRNFGLRTVQYDLTAFFDDDVVLEASCLSQMEAAHRASSTLAGVGCFAEAWRPPTPLWRLRRALGIVPTLRPGTYTRTGLSVPWCFQPPTADLVEGDWLPGCAMMLKTSVARDVGFDEQLAGYGQGEDLDFSLRLRERGRIVLAGSARCEHFHASEGRPDSFKLGRMEICNRYRIWRRVYGQPRWRDWLAFTYAWSLDTILLLRDAVRPRYALDGLRRVAGRMSGVSRLFRSRLPE